MSYYILNNQTCQVSSNSLHNFRWKWYTTMWHNAIIRQIILMKVGCKRNVFLFPISSQSAFPKFFKRGVTHPIMFWSKTIKLGIPRNYCWKSDFSRGEETVGIQAAWGSRGIPRLSVISLCIQKMNWSYRWSSAERVLSRHEAVFDPDHCMNRAWCALVNVCNLNAHE